MCILGTIIILAGFVSIGNAGLNDFYDEGGNGEKVFSKGEYIEGIAGYLDSLDPAVIPLFNLVDTLNLTIEFSLLSLTNFDELSGKVGIVAVFNMSWMAETHPTWNGQDKQSFTIPTEKIWKPQLVLLNPISKVSDLAQASNNLKIFHNRWVQWTIITTIEASCNIDVTLFPFDSQTCNIMISPWGYDSTEVGLSAVIGSNQDETYVENSGWKLQDLKIETSGIEIPHLTVKLQFRRQYEYFLVNILLPPVLLSILSPCVFLLPASSGERMSFAVTCFLAFSVYMSTISDNMPKSAVPLAHLSYFMVYMLIHSCTVTVAAVITLRTYHKDGLDPVPRWLQVFIKLVRFRYCRKYCQPEVDETPIQKLHNKSLSRKESIYSIKEAGKVAEVILVDEPDEEITWHCVGRTLDFFFFVVFLGWMLFTIITFYMAVSII